MTEWLGMPPLASAHGGQIDSLIGWIHVFMFILFIGWGGFFLYCLMRFRKSRNPVADYTGVTSPASKYSEIAVAVIEGILLVAFAIPLWAARVEHVPSASEALIVQVTGEQFAWNIHYAGPDGVFGRTDIKLLDLQSNPLGLDRDDPAAKDDVVTLNQLYLPCEQAGRRQAQKQGRHPQLRRAGVPREAGRDPRSHDPDLVRPQRHDRGNAYALEQTRVPVRDCLRAALRPGSRQDAGICHRPDRRRVPDVAGRTNQGAERTGSLPVVRVTRGLGKAIMQTLLQHARRLGCLTVLAVVAAPPLAAQSLPYESMAARIVTALQVTRGERVLLRVDPNTMAQLEPLVRKALEARGAVVETLPYGPAPDFEARLAKTDVYVWLPAPATATPGDQALALQRWIDNGPGRELHFHWVDGTRDVDGLPARHTPAFDRVYAAALDIDYRQLATQMDQAIQRLRSAEVTVTTPSGTDIRFRVGDRPFNKQDGDGSKPGPRRGEFASIVTSSCRPASFEWLHSKSR
jgi:hypothetical protein